MIRYGQMVPSEAWSDDGGIEWCVLVTGDGGPIDHLFTVYGSTKTEAELKASHIVTSIITYEAARTFLTGSETPVPYNTSRPLDAEGIDIHAERGKVTVREGGTFEIEGPGNPTFG